MNRLLLTAALIAAPTTVAVAQTPMAASTYVMKAGAGDQYEIQSSKLVLQTTGNAKIRDFATMMVTDHTKSTADVAAAAKAAGMNPGAPHLDAMGAKNIAALRVAKGKLRDTLYLRQQKAAHQKALALHKGYAADGTVPGLKTVADNVAGVVQHHIDELNAM